VHRVGVRRSAALIVLVLVLAADRATAAGESSLDLPRAPAQLAVRPKLELDLFAAVAIAGGALATSGIARSSAAADLTACRWCEPGRFDVRARQALRWDDTAAAANASDTLRLAVPLGSAAAVAWLALREGDRRELFEDVLAIAGAVALAAPFTGLAKHEAGRLRPGAWAAGSAGGEGDLHAFYSSHTSQVFAAAGAAAQVARLRGRAGWRWVAAAAFAASAATAWLRVAADQHWATDVLTGAAAGTAIGLAVPSLVLRRRRAAAGAPRPWIAAITPAPGGLLLAF
jgi:membrane-associated phospholipid phosphatase